MRAVVGVGWHHEPVSGSVRLPESSGPVDTTAAAGPPPLVLVVGDEPFLVDRAVSRAVAAARRAAPGVERRDALATDLTPAAFSDLVSPSLFAEPRVVIVRGAHEAGKDVAAVLGTYADTPVEGVTLVVHHSGGARNKAVTQALRVAGATVLTCDKITRLGERLEFVRAEIRRAGGTCTSEAVAALVDAVGSDLRELASAADQLVADTGGRVDLAAVRRYHRGRGEVTGFAVADAVVAGDARTGVETLRWALSIGVAPVLIADALADGVRTVAQVSGAGRGNSYTIASRLGMAPWKVDKARQAARGWSERGLARGMTVVADLNAAVKGVAVDTGFALEKAVLDLVAARQLP